MGCAPCPAPERDDGDARNRRRRMDPNRPSMRSPDARAGSFRLLILHAPEPRSAGNYLPVFQRLIELGAVTAPMVRRWAMKQKVEPYPIMDENVLILDR